MRRSTTYAAIAVIIAGAAALGGCSHDSGGSSTSAGSSAELSGGVASAAPNAPAARAGVPTRAAAGSDVTTTGKITSTAEIRRARMTVAIRGSQNVAAKADAAEGIALSLGGEVDADDRTSGTNATADLVLRVPPDDLEKALGDLSALGIERSRELSTVDVSQEVADVTSRVASAHDAIAQLRTLYRRATKVSDVIRIESQLSSRESDLEALQARERTLARQTAQATVTLSLVTAPKHVVAPPPPAPKPGGFVGGVERGWHGFVSTLAWLAGALGTVLPFVVTVAVLAVVAWWLRRRWRSPSAPASPAGE